MRGRRMVVTTLLVLGTLFWTGFAIGLWGERQALDSDEWVETSGALLENEPIRTALGLFLVDRIYQSSDVQARLEEALPPRLDRLAAPAAAALKEVARRNAPRLLGNAFAIAAWKEANELAHERLIDIVEGGDVTVALQLDELLGQIAASTGLPADVVDRLPPRLATLEVATADEVDAVRRAVNFFEAVVWVLLGLALACFAAAVLLSTDRRREVVRVGGGLVLAGVLVLAARRLTGAWVVDSLAEAPNAQGVADDAWDIATSLLVDTTWGSILLGLFLVSGAWLAGPGRRAAAARRFQRARPAGAPGRGTGRPRPGHPVARRLGSRALDPAARPRAALHRRRLRLARVDPGADTRRVSRHPTRGRCDRREGGNRTMTEIGPVQLISVRFEPGANFEGRIVDGLARLESERSIRISTCCSCVRGRGGGAAADERSRRASGSPPTTSRRWLPRSLRASRPGSCSSSTCGRTRCGGPCGTPEEE